MIAKLLKIHPKRQEAIGTAIALIAAFWEFSVLRTSVKEVETAPVLEITHKLNHLWNAHSVSNAEDYVAKHLGDFHKHNYLQNRERIEDAFLVGQFGYVRTLLFTLGGVLVVWAKWREGAVRKA
jgi:hypothetical protein